MESQLNSSLKPEAMNLTNNSFIEVKPVTFGVSYVGDVNTIEAATN